MSDFTVRLAVKRGTFFGVPALVLYYVSPHWDVYHHILICTAMYIFMSMGLAQQFRNKTYYYAGTGYPAWSWYQSFVHNFLVNVALLGVILILHPPTTGAWNEWLGSSKLNWLELKDWNSLQFAEKIDVLALCLGIAHELKDALLMDIQLTSFSFGLVAHHTVTIAGCLGCLYVPVGRGIVVLNSVNAYLGSSTFNIATTLPIILPHRTDLCTSARYLYYCIMTASNVIGLYLAFEFDKATGRDSSISPLYAQCYWIATWALVILRQGGMFQMLLGSCEISSSDKAGKKL